MKGTGKMEVKKELDIIFMGMEYIWESVMKAIEMVKECIFSKMDHVMKVTGSREREKDGECIYIKMVACILDIIKME